MSGFSPEWLSLREPVDHRARDTALLRRLAEHLKGRDSVTVLDLGCGTGSNLRAVAGALPVRWQNWRLIDYDAVLLAAARSEVAAWARRNGAGRPKLCLHYETADLRTALPELLAGECDVVTAAALLDLVSAEWLTTLANLVAERRLPLYAVLNFDGVMNWQPPHPADEDIAAAFAAHQRTDKGFGTACGPDAATTLATLLAGHNYDVHTASSPWQLGSADAALIAATNAGIADAARATGRLSAAAVDAWHAAHAGCRDCCVGHVDLLALPCD